MLRFMPPKNYYNYCAMHMKPFAENLSVLPEALTSGDQVEPEFLEAYGHLDCQWKGIRVLVEVAQVVDEFSGFDSVLYVC